MKERRLKRLAARKAAAAKKKDTARHGNARAVVKQHSREAEARAKEAEAKQQGE